MPTVLVTFDMDSAADSPAREKAYDALIAQGLSRLSENKKLRLPFSTVLGNTEIANTPQDILKALKKIMEDAAGEEIKRMAVAFVTEWCVYGNPDSKLQANELLTVFLAMVKQGA